MVCRLFGVNPVSKPIPRVVLIVPAETNFNEISALQEFLFKEMSLIVQSAKWRPFYHTYSVFKDTEVF